MKIHKAAKLLPDLSDDEFKALRADIVAHGLLCPIELHDDQIIDGRHRYKICQLEKIEPDFIEVSLDGQTPGQYVFSLNILGRHLTVSQRAMAAVKLLPELKEAARKRRGRKQLTQSEPDQAKMPDQVEDGQVRDIAAAVASVSSRSVSDAATVAAKSPELANEVMDGTKTLGRAKSEIKQQEKLDALTEKAAAAEVSDDPLWTLVNMDVIEGLASLDEHPYARLIVTDPPYNIGVDYGPGKKADSLDDSDYLTWCDAWIQSCHDALEADGSFWLIINDQYAAELCVACKRVGFHLRSWVIWYETFGQNIANNFNRTHRHIFYFVVDPKHFLFNADAVTRPSDRQAKYNDKRAVEGGKTWDDVWEIPRLTGTCDERIPTFPTQLPLALVEPIVRCASDPGDLVIDPFNGSGTTGVAAIRNGRKYIGIDKSKAFIDLADKRLRCVDDI